MKNLTLNGDWAIATAAFAQFYDSFAWDNDTALTAFDFGNEQTLFESLEGEFGPLCINQICERHKGRKYDHQNTKTGAFNQRFHFFRPLLGRHRRHHLIAMEDTQAPLKSPISRHLQCSCPAQ